MTTDIIIAEARDVTPFTAAEKKALAKHEATIRSGLRSFVDVGQALIAIRDGRLYRQTFGTFEEYANTVWFMARRTAYNYIEAASVPHAAQLPSIEHAQLLGRLPEDKQEALAERLAGMTRDEARDFVRDFDKVPEPAVKRVQELFKDEPEPTNGWPAFRDAAQAIDFQTLTLDELAAAASVIQTLVKEYGVERKRRSA